MLGVISLNDMVNDQCVAQQKPRFFAIGQEQLLFLLRCDLGRRCKMPLDQIFWPGREFDLRGELALIVCNELLADLQRVTDDCQHGLPRSDRSQ